MATMIIYAVYTLITGRRSGGSLENTQISIRMYAVLATKPNHVPPQHRGLKLAGSGGDCMLGQRF